MPTNFHLCGVCYSGKTTLARELQKRYGFKHLDLDALKAAQGYGGVGDGVVPKTIWQEIFRQANQFVTDELQGGRSVISENAWDTRAHRDALRNLAEAAGAKTLYIRILVSEEEIRRRWRENGLTGTRFQWPEREFEWMIHNFEELQEDEPSLYYDGATDIESWIGPHIN